MKYKSTIDNPVLAQVYSNWGFSDHYQAYGSGSTPFDVRLASMISWIRQVHFSFSKLSFFHVLRENNKEVDRYGNLATLKNEGTLALNNMDNINLYLES
jgi:hypothetical protein